MVKRRKSRAPVTFFLPVLALTLCAADGDAQPTAKAPQCGPTGSVVKLPALTEGSGIAASRRQPGRAWAHNDSGEPILLALDAGGMVTGRIRLEGVDVNDWEALAVGPCPTGSCLYVGDIGDNGADRKEITVYRFPEPDSPSGSVTVRDVFRASYPDGARDAEALLVTPKGELFVVTKGESGPVAVYRFPREASPGGRATLERVGNPRDDRTSEDGRITDGAVSPNGEWIVLRTTRVLHFYPASALLAGSWREAGRVDISALREPQGEGVTFASDTTLFLLSEGGGGSQPGTFARMTCAL